ncbi:MAG: hypothetical protein JO093_03915 [Acidobacteria bacterium]|nr:hypothetical protein [Acidobacteriota bacterium]MBV9184737.1 hypothetical protein [Acidobacteriota bacterium]
MRNLIDMSDKEAVFAALDAPKVPLTKNGLGDPTIAENTDELLDSFGDDGDER